MINWRHPRIFERLRCFGLSLFTLGLASHNSDNPPAAIAAIFVTLLLVVRLKIELEIGGDEEQGSLERKLHQIHEINQVIVAPVIFGVITIFRKINFELDNNTFLN